MYYLIATVIKNHRPGRIWDNTRSKPIALKKAEMLARKHKVKIGIFAYERNRYYGLFDVFNGYMY